MGKFSWDHRNPFEGVKPSASERWTIPAILAAIIFGAVVGYMLK